jgi:hypothetical protein
MEQLTLGSMSRIRQIEQYPWIEMQRSPGKDRNGHDPQYPEKKDGANLK